MMTEVSDLFPSSFETSRARFRNNLGVVQKLWPDAQHNQHRLEGEEDLTIDWISARGVERTEKFLILTTGEHGIEGYVGSAMLQRFVELFLPRLNPQNTGLLLVHMIDPWGMKHMRRTNAANVDLNRNFLYDPKAISPAFNPEYAQLEAFFEPRGPVGNFFLETLKYLSGLAYHRTRIGHKLLWQAARLGQYSHSKGLHFGGDAIQEETRLMMGLYREAFQVCDHIVHLDMHTGWGPRYQMSLINSALDSRSSAECVRAYNYPQVAAATADEFYALQGDMIDYVYTLRDLEFPDTRLYSTSFEFGTFGDSPISDLRDLRTMIFENRLYWHGARNQRIHEKVKDEFREFFFPTQKRWQEKAVVDADMAFQGILEAERLF
jgi:hypothetical protein